MSKGPGLLQVWFWQRRIARMKRCETSAALTRRFGEPDHKLEQQGVAIWHYRLRVIDGNQYALHVAVMNDRVSQVYVHVSPVAAPGTPPSSP